MDKIRILLVDDHPLFRQALRTAIEAEPDLQVVGEASDGAQAVRAAGSLGPDVIVMDLYLPVLDGVGAIAQIVGKNPEARILAITSSTEDKQVVAAVQAGASGYLLKDVSRADFLEGLRQVARGQMHLPPEVAAKLARGVQDATRPAGDEGPLEPLTAREQEILSLLGQGLSNKAVAERLSLSESTVRVHLHNLMKKLGLQDRGQVIVYALRTAR